ncbi:YopX family protein [Lacticaseibacillus paracasei]|uniref:YopX family protein n=1 Tax=Lacticaseibacillus paracasei TaxID=1597 RepID=UPI000F0B13B7|nr:YopX family protein [Lacticaseibacillus paracasei]RNE05599.1 YopX protein [Lacticaseibacillus paracasei]
MKREIKFRAWNKKDKVMVDVASINFWPDGVLSVLEDVDDAEPQLADGYELMQYTGLHDKNGRDIYEGDIIVTHPKSRYEAPKSGVVQFGGHCPSFGYKTEDGEEYDIWSSNAYRTYEVIGNIFEDKQLLEGKQ